MAPGNTSLLTIEIPGSESKPNMFRMATKRSCFISVVIVSIILYYVYHNVTIKKSDSYVSSEGK